MGWLSGAKPKAFTIWGNDMNFFTWLLNRLMEPSTWYGMTTVLTSVGVQLEPALAEQIITAGVGIAGTIAIVTKDKRR